ncbi:MAG: hypothetical protein ACTSU5_05725 [Promethearchaeota archaeon]
MSNEDTKERLMDWLVRFGIDRERIHQPSEEDIENAPENLREFLRNLLVIPYPLTLAGGEDGGESELELEANIVFDEKWIQIKLLLLRGQEIPKSLEKRLYRELLEGNFDLNEVTYSLSPDGDVFVEADMPVVSTYENFESEYGSVEFGADYFLTEIIPKLQESIKVATFADASSRMYI